MELEISSYDLEKLRPIKNSRHKGNFGGCYLFGNLALKYFDNLDLKKFSIPLEARLDELTKIKVPGVSLPINLVYCNKKFVGYTMPYYNGPTLTRILLEYKLGRRIITKEDIFKFYCSILSKIEQLSYNKIKVNDIKSDNIIFYNGNLNLVDCDFYSLKKDMEKEDVYKYNLKLLNEAFVKILQTYFDKEKNISYKDMELENENFINDVMKHC